MENNSNKPFDLSKKYWEAIREIFDLKYKAPIIENVNGMKYSKYLDDELKEHIVSLFISNRFFQGFNTDLAELHFNLKRLKTNDSSQIHIICSHSDSVHYSKAQPEIKYYSLEQEFTGRCEPNLPEDPYFIVETKFLRIGRKRSYWKKNSDSYSEREIMRDLMNGDGEIHGF